MQHKKRRHISRLLARLRERRSNEAGYTLVEVLIYSSLMVLIFTLVGGILLNAMESEQKVLASADANGVSQLIVTSISSGMRNATQLDLPENTPDDPDDQLLVLTTVSSDPAQTAADRVCQAWFYTEENGGAMYYQRGATPEAINATSVDNLTGWTLLGSGLFPNGQPIFSGANTVNPAITLNFMINADGDGSPALISTAFKTRQGPSTETARCFEIE
ncbi:hypothetical protein [Cryobacterium serini]|uniref:Uncharacterized protein n=1 Tax=Cryobacterium serini TaxID=1259201 RepID=A0A4R9BNW5_9MICO|nr:hypothetical protein [Cryobacterium serini]TFD87758.1 hypothetical protein E3T51_09800 [Cryobacterium serini]